MRRSIALATLLTLAAAVPAGEPPRTPLDEDTLAWFRGARAMSLERLRENLATLGETGGFFPRLVSDEMLCGMALGHARRHPNRIDQLLDFADAVAEEHRADYYGALCLAVGPTLRPRLAERAREDGPARALLARLEDQPWPRFADLDPARRAVRGLLAGVLLVHGDPECAARLATRLAHADADRAHVAGVLAGAAAMDRSVRDLLHDMAVLAEGNAKADLEWAVAEADRVHPR